MKKYITIFITFFILFSCNKDKKSENLSENDYKHNGEITTPKGDKVHVTLAVLENDQIRGLSGVRPEDFGKDKAMLFYYTNDDFRRFWMPDTYFNLDIFFLDANLKVIDVDRDVPYHPGRQNPEKIPTTRTIYCRHVLEMNAKSEFSKKIKIGDTLTWSSKLTLQQIAQDIRQHQ